MNFYVYHYWWYWIYQWADASFSYFLFLISTFGAGTYSGSPLYPLNVYWPILVTNCDKFSFACLYSDSSTLLLLFDDVVAVFEVLSTSVLFLTRIFLPWTLAAIVSHTVLANTSPWMKLYLKFKWEVLKYDEAYAESWMLSDRIIVEFGFNLNTLFSLYLYLASGLAYPKWSY